MLRKFTRNYINLCLMNYPKNKTPGPEFYYHTFAQLGLKQVTNT